ncbi:MAG TPA: amylo-alpha-1,6-glucosidase [Methylomirabilota bacterium]|nr:amylo-alpha-1,6-glucosidase [Methylomirabilota bacterium]
MSLANLVRRIEWSSATTEQSEERLTREWLVTNGLGGYASGTVAGVTTRRYHGLLVAALPAPLGRVLMLNHLTERYRTADGAVYEFGSEERVGAALGSHAEHLTEFRLEAGLPVWRYAFGDAVVERRLLLPHRQNTVHLSWRNVSGAAPLRLTLRPALHFRLHEAPVSSELEGAYALTAIEDRYEIRGPAALPTLRLLLHGEHPAFTVEARRIEQVLYRVERSRGYAATGTLWSPGFFRATLAPGKEATLIASTESWEVMTALSPQGAQDAERERRRRLVVAAPAPARTGFAAELVLAADQFVITPSGRVEDAARARAAGDEVRTVIAGYHWFTDWGRDTMISLEGLTLATGRHLEAGYILRTFGHYVRDGLIPNLFPEGENRGMYHTADATLWFFHALDRYVETTGDRVTLGLLRPVLQDVVAHHLRGTRFGIGVDPADGLLRQGAPEHPLTWMDAKVEDWIPTPRRGKAVEINALWYNALRLLEGWTRDIDGEAAAKPYGELAARAADAFNARFWYPGGEYCYDVIDGERGDDPACRPNQILAVALRHPVLDAARWERVVDVVRERLVTPVGLRSLSPEHPDYKPRYFGDLRARDAAYHQGTVWAWLIGPFVDAWLRVHPSDRRGAQRWLEGFEPHLSEAGVGSISEIFDAEAPFTPRGCIAQAWSVAEVLRGWLKCCGEPYQ